MIIFLWMIIISTSLLQVSAFVPTHRVSTLTCRCTRSQVVWKSDMWKSGVTSSHKAAMLDYYGYDDTLRERMSHPVEPGPLAINIKKKWLNVWGLLYGIAIFASALLVIPFMFIAMLVDDLLGSLSCSFSRNGIKNYISSFSLYSSPTSDLGLITILTAAYKQAANSRDERLTGWFMDGPCSP